VRRSNFSKLFLEAAMSFTNLSGAKHNTKAKKAPRLKERGGVLIHLSIAYLGGLLSGLTLDQWELISGFAIAFIAPLLAWITQASAN
jgi:hypothetical protein